MSELTWEKLSLLNVEAIDDAAGYWSTYVDSLASAADAIEKDVPAIIDESSFGGETGTGCRSQLRAIAGEIHDHVEEAGSRIKAVLREAYEDLSTCRTDMRDLVDQVLDSKLRISDDGEVHLSEARIAEIQAWAQQQVEAEGRGDADGLAQEKIAWVEVAECQPLTARIRGLVETAKDYDNDYTARLNAICDAPVEMPPPLGSDWHQDVAEYWANRAIDLLNGGEDGELSPEELDEFNTIVAEHAGSPVFATMLMNRLGPAGLITHLGEVAPYLGDVAMNVHLEDEAAFTPEQVNDMYRALGLALATATDPTNPVHVDQAWVTELMNLGGTVTTSHGWHVYGYELLAPTLAHGRYHEDFLVPVTEHMIAIDASQGWSSVPPVLGLAPPDRVDYGYSPVDWALVALDHNPQAALNLFITDDVGTTGLDDIEGVNLDGLEPVDDPFAYLMDRAQYDQPFISVSPDLLGNTLEAATTGVSTDPAYAPDAPPVHNHRMAALTDRLIDHVLEHRDEFTGGPRSGMLDNFGSITATYIDDFQRAFATADSVEWTVDQPGADLSIGSPGDENLDRASDWLRVVGHHQGAIAEVWGASEALMFHQLERELADDGSHLGIAFDMHGQVISSLTEGSLDAIAAGVYQEQADQNRLVDLFAEGAKQGAGLVTAGITQNPVIGGAVSQGVGYGIDIVKKLDFFSYTDEDAIARIEELADEQLNRNEDNVLSHKTLDRIRQILRTDRDLTNEDIEDYVEDYKRSYWLSVHDYADRFTG